MKNKLIFCQTKVNSSGIKRETRDGVEHIVITSYTLPPNVVMNRGLYPADEVERSFNSLERTLAPIEHPEVNGQYISASDPIAINNFYGGAWNENVEQIQDGRIKIDKVVNVQEAMKSEKGKRLLDRIGAIEDGSDSRSIHTSVGVFVEVDPLGEMETNEAGEEFDWVARNMVFDHDAILLDSIGAATPSKGVGIGVNKEKVDVEFFVNDADQEAVEFKTENLDNIPDNFLTNQEMSFSDIHDALFEQINLGVEDYDKRNWIVAVFDDSFVFETNSGEMFRSNYSIDVNGNLEINDSRLPVERVVEFRPLNPLNSEEATMRDQIIAELKKLGMTVNSDMSDAELLAKYSEATLSANQGDDKADETIQANKDLAEVVKTQAEQIESLSDKLAANEAKELDEKVKLIKANKKYSAISETALKAIHANNQEDFDAMHIDSIPSQGVGSTTDFSAESESAFKLNTEIDNLPE
jgi:hypothetical protein